jgi:ABC-type transport system involved in Fe-S cluster assembly fused permease/ATPase subunit
VRSFDPEHLMGFMASVYQGVVLFNDTVAANIRVDSADAADAADAEVRTAAHQARCDEFVARLRTRPAATSSSRGCPRLAKRRLARTARRFCAASVSASQFWTV